MYHQLFWILVNGAVLIPDSLHILSIVATPELYGESKESIQDTFQRHGQSINSNVESKGREEVLLRVLKRNNIRIRKNTLKHNQHWSIQLFRLTQERKAAICNWAKLVVSDKGDQYADTIIHQLFDNSKIRTSLNRLADECTAEKAPKIIKQSDLVGKKWE